MPGAEHVVAGVVRELRDAVLARVVELREDPGWGAVAWPHMHFEFPRFKYGEAGLREYELRQSVVLKDLWIGKPLEDAIAGIQPEIEAAAVSLSELHPDPSIVHRAAVHLCEGLMLDALEGDQLADDEVKRRAQGLVRSLSALPMRAWINADLVGVSVLCPPLQFAWNGMRISLRAPTPDDLGGDIYLEWAGAAERRLKSRPSALLRLEYETTDGTSWQPHLESAVAILQLFGVGGVAWTRVEAGTESLVNVHGAIMLVDQDGGSRKTYAIDAAGAARLPRFWEALGATLPREFYWHQPEDPVGLDAAWFNFGREAGRFGYVHERIAAVIRSLESLFVRDAEKENITKTLAGRAAALLDACGFDPGEVRRSIRWAYEVRSRYVHGGTLSPDKLRQIETAVGGLVPLLYRCLEYNRAALVAAVLIGVDKSGFLRLLKDNEALRRAGAAYREAHSG